MLATITVNHIFVVMWHANASGFQVYPGWEVMVESKTKNLFNLLQLRGVSGFADYLYFGWKTDACNCKFIRLKRNYNLVSLYVLPSSLIIICHLTLLFFYLRYGAKLVISGELTGGNLLIVSLSGYRKNLFTKGQIIFRTVSKAERDGTKQI